MNATPCWVTSCCVRLCHCVAVGGGQNNTAELVSTLSRRLTGEAVMAALVELGCIKHLTGSVAAELLLRSWPLKVDIQAVLQLL